MRSQTIRWTCRRCHATPRVGEIYGEDELVRLGPFKRPTLRAIDAELRTINAGPQLRELPTLWLHGEEDQLVPTSSTG